MKAETRKGEYRWRMEEKSKRWSRMLNGNLLKINSYDKLMLERYLEYTILMLTLESKSFIDTFCTAKYKELKTQ